MKPQRLLPILCLITLPACTTLTKAKPEPRPPSGTVSIKVDAHGENKVPIYLAVSPAGTDKELRFYRVQDGSVTGFILPVDQTYDFRAFVDHQANGQPLPGEPVGTVKGIKPDPDLTKDQQPVLLDIPAGAGKPNKPAKKDKATAPAASTSDDALLKQGLKELKEALPNVPSVPIPPPPSQR